MDKGPAKESLKEVTRESLIAISYAEPDKAFTSKLSSDKFNGGSLDQAIDSDAEEKFRAELISISYEPSAEPGSLPVTNGKLKD